MTQPRIVFTSANLVDGVNPAQRGVTVIVEGERITHVGAGAAPDSRPGDRMVDLSDKTLMPGMFQCHFHAHFGAFGEGVGAPALGLEGSPAYLAMLTAKNAGICLDHGYTGAVGSSNAHVIDVALKEAILAGHVRGPRYLACTRELVTTGDYSDYSNNRNWFMELGNTGLTLQADGADGWRRAVRSELGKGADIVKISASAGHGSMPARGTIYQTPDELHACVDTAHELGKLVRAHVATRDGILACARAGVDVIDHADRIDRECIDAILEAGSFVVPSMLWTVRFLEVAENWDHAERTLQINEGFPESLDDTLARIRGVREDFEYTCRAMPDAVAAGVKMVVGDDFGTPIMPHGDYAAELVFYVKQLGISPLEVIRWATSNGAELMGHGGDLGRIEAGRLADVVVLDGDPLQDITCLADPANVLAVLKGGEVVKDLLGEPQSPLAVRA
ncbi:MAG: amidohydrolase family protein [Myxococcota bacterium]|jgi:imidazolonepropionase-like amidohydrolase|nr:amidohydrolase family protein [bacterium]MDP7074404.1 amidohydrolase family protein [Myxococcota bacterium]MDP7300558.1 amidohydrolase family protein [Myxococcota bacterium]MDP7434157.1 amidohydrolase family protein [Myxococcota bacterium]HJO25414.1 amidohydrolase family protein [Myxococcota bacterium]